MIKPPQFWHRQPGPLALLLRPAGALYGFGAWFRQAMTTPARVSVPLICVGNPTLGGAGKTPAALAIAEVLKAGGLAPHFLTRGYGGRLKGPLRVDAAAHSAADVGDEPLLLAGCAPTHVSGNRAAGARQAAAGGADVIIMDDGFQNPTLHKDISILVVDGGAGIGNGLVFPAGPLREAFGGQMARADAVVIVGPGAQGDAAGNMAATAGVLVLRAFLKPEVSAQTLEGTRLLAFCGIGRPAKFLQTLSGLKAEIAGHVAFADHHPYRPADIARIIALAKTSQVETIVTTQKDYVRFDETNDPKGRFRHRLTLVSIELKFENPDRLAALLEDKLPAGAQAGEQSQDAPSRSR